MYISPLDAIVIKQRNFFKEHHILSKFSNWDVFFSWVMEQIFDDIERILSFEQRINSMNLNDLVKLVYFPSMILKWLIEVKIEQQKFESKKSCFHKDIHEIILHTSKSCLEVYKKSEKAIEYMQESFYRIQNMKRGISNLLVNWIYDRVSLLNYHPYLSWASSDLLKSIFWNDKWIFLSIWNGWIPAGMDVYLRSWIKNTGVIFYPIRFSQYKNWDLIPQLNLVEEEFLRINSYKWFISIFDEDASSWGTLLITENYINERIGEGNIYAFSNDGKYHSQSIKTNNRLYSIEY
jgi:hypothetical protein